MTKSWWMLAVAAFAAATLIDSAHGPMTTPGLARSWRRPSIAVITGTRASKVSRPISPSLAKENRQRDHQGRRDQATRRRHGRVRRSGCEEAGQ